MRNINTRALCLIALLLSLPMLGGWSAPPANASPGPYVSGSVHLLNAAQAVTFANPAFQRTWERTDKPVAAGQVQRSWYWGPIPNSAGLQENFLESPGGTRLVQYFDKSRMELSNPNADPNSPFFVTNGLLAVELISGQMQVGNSAYTDRWPADIPLASDPDDTTAPTYLSFQAISNTPLGDHPADSLVGQPAILTIARNGTVGTDATKSSYPRVNIAYYDPTTRHNVPQAIWEFLNDTGPVYDSATGNTSNARLSDPWFYASGLPISEAYWARVKVAGQQQDVLIQAFERRIVTYIPNGVPGFKVQMGNIGQHYYDWRYNDAGRPQTPLPTPTPNAPATTPTPIGPPVQPTATPAPESDCSGIPASHNMVVSPTCGPGGTDFAFQGSGFRPSENVGIYVTEPSQAVFGAPFQATADNTGAVTGIGLRTDSSFPAGVWAITMEGTSTHNKAIGYFKIIRSGPPPGTPSPGDTSCNNVPASQNMQISPSNCGPVGTRFAFVGRGFRPGENVGAYITAPDQSVFGADFQLTADSNGVAGTVVFRTDSSFPIGVWALTMEGTTSHNKAIGYFKLTP